MRKVLCSVGAGAHEELLDISGQTFALYAERHGYDLEVVMLGQQPLQELSRARLVIRDQHANHRTEPLSCPVGVALRIRLGHRLSLMYVSLSQRTPRPRGSNQRRWPGVVTYFADVKPEQYLGLFITGGRAPEYLRYDQHLMAITRHFFEKNKPVASVCHGIEIPAAADCLKGRTATTVAKCALDITQVGGKYVNQPVVVDGNFVTARVWMDNTPFVKEFIKLLKAAR